jgi:hypothetical protein
MLRCVRLSLASIWVTATITVAACSPGTTSVSERGGAVVPDDEGTDASAGSDDGTGTGTAVDGADPSVGSVRDAGANRPGARRGDAGTTVPDSSPLPRDSGAAVCATENTACAENSCCGGLTCSRNRICNCEGVRCSSGSGPCCSGSPYCTAPRGFFTTSCSASPGHYGAACRETSDCGNGVPCTAGICEAPCKPDCTGKTCGADQCGGSCGACNNGQTCDGRQCIAPPQPPVCDPVTNTGCTLPNECILLANELQKCALLGTGTQGSPCSATTLCSGGHGCFAGTCRKICSLGVGAMCPGTTTCKSVAGWLRYGTCG